MNKEKVLDYIVYGLVIVMMVLTIIFQKNSALILLIYSIGALIIGVLSLIGSKQYGILLIVVSLNILTTYLLYKLEVLSLPKCLTFMICSSVITLLLVTIIVTRITFSKLKKVYSMTIEAEVIDLIKEPNTKQEYYLPVYLYKFKELEYEINGLNYMKRSLPKIGSKTIINIDPNNPTEVYFFPSKFDYLKNLLGSLLFIIVCIVIIINIFVR